MRTLKKSNLDVAAWEPDVVAQGRHVARTQSDRLKNTTSLTSLNEDVAAQVLDVAPSTIYYNLLYFTFIKNVKTLGTSERHDRIGTSPFIFRNHRGHGRR